MADKKGLTTYEVLDKVEEMIRNGGRYRIDKVYADLSIFDWWDDYLSQSKLKEMRAFLKTAVDLNYLGYVCFKVGASGCANGMWAYKRESEDGYSPNEGGALYRSFTPDYVSWDLRRHDKTWLSDDHPEWHHMAKLRDVKVAIKEGQV